jgi:hypothetical protein
LCIGALIPWQSAKLAEKRVKPRLSFKQSIFNAANLFKRSQNTIFVKKNPIKTKSKLIKHKE